mmetsp:Transcript_20096/g.51138  ORF Transcript_20096/g.51138 Transcript_20096/m.51138 type:complete len:184 (-) Transcript_20096:396-947(-)
MPAAREAALTEDNLRKLGGASQAEQEEALLDKMQTLSNLLAQVNGALDDEPATTVPSTAGSSRRPPPTAERLPTSGSQRPPTTGGRLPTGQRATTPAAAPTADQPRDSFSRGSKGHEPQVMSLSELNKRDAPVQLVTYTGSQSQLAGMSARRKVDARATKSEIGSLLSWGGDDKMGYYLTRES